jgi:hypothetical protein
MDMLTPLSASGTLTPVDQQFSNSGSNQSNQRQDHFLNNNGNTVNSNNTWTSLATNVNIDLDNLGKKNEAKPKKSMNQLAANVSGMSLTGAPQQPSPSHGANYLINQTSSPYGKF